MKYENIEEAVFINRINRFVAEIKVKGEACLCHVKNTGRCKELLIRGCKIYVEKSNDVKRKTKYSLICVVKNNILINMDSQAPNKVVYEWLKEGNLITDYDELKSEKAYGSSRFDFYISSAQRKAFVEVKGVTLEEDGIVRFPDAPTQRGIKHLRELSQAVRDGFEAYVFFAVQMNGVKYFEPNRANGDDFYIALKEAYENGVKIIAYDCIVEPNMLKINKRVRVRIDAFTD